MKVEAAEWVPARAAGSTPKKGRVAEEGFIGVQPGSGVIMMPPVSVCHHVSTTRTLLKGPGGELCPPARRLLLGWTPPLPPNGGCPSQ